MNQNGVVNGEVDEPLIELGIKQAAEVAKELPKTIKYIYTSPLQRASKTASIISEHLKVPVTEVKELAEIKMGDLAGKAWSEMPDGENLKLQHRTVNFDYRQFGGESVNEVINRVKQLIKTVSDSHLDEEVLFVTHGGIMRVLNYLDTKKAIYETKKNLSVVKIQTDNILS